MILYCAADPKYFDLYFDLWEKQTSKIYPELRRHIALYNPSDEAKQKCVDHMVDFNDITEWFPENPTRNHFYLLRWLYLPLKISFTRNLIVLHLRLNKSNSNKFCFFDVITSQDCTEGTLSMA